MKRIAGEVVGLMAPLAVVAAAKSGLLDGDPWTVWAPLLAIAAALFAVLAIRHRRNSEKR